ncbi:hypothetical protein [Halobaculum litoreum]|uniref:Uncharacterized protein n=1 Tax=Halobaculum litoreum TaxID=3031998 RepID=A0ABD5XV42_9EURY|nr:hypothetical protein [Halobaculum sp. DT92]
MIRRIRSFDRRTRIQYGLMLTFGLVCLVAAVAPVADSIRVAAVATTFGLTAGLWIAHLVQVLDGAARRAAAR